MPGTYDAATDTVFYGTGNPGKDFVISDREGDNLCTDSVIALDPIRQAEMVPGRRS
jgi:alcohol dehydrogenase (cytochrome c)